MILLPKGSVTLLQNVQARAETQMRGSFGGMQSKLVGFATTLPLQQHRARVRAAGGPGGLAFRSAAREAGGVAFAATESAPAGLDVVLHAVQLSPVEHQEGDGNQGLLQRGRWQQRWGGGAVRLDCMSGKCRPTRKATGAGGRLAEKCSSSSCCCCNPAGSLHADPSSAWQRHRTLGAQKVLLPASNQYTSAALPPRPVECSSSYGTNKQNAGLWSHGSGVVASGECNSCICCCSY